MNAVEFFKEKDRMCAWAGPCINCDLSMQLNGHAIDCDLLIKRHIEEAVEIVEKWSKEHPVKTYKSVFLEKFPNANMNKILPIMCPKDFGLTNSIPKDCNYTLCDVCWDRPVEK